MIKNFAAAATFAAAIFGSTRITAHAQERVFPEAHPNPLRELRVIGFAGGFNLPIWAGQRQGFFAEEGLEINFSFTPGSTYQMSNLIAGNYDIAMTAIDNVIAYREAQNEAYIPAETPVDVVAVLGSDDAFLSLVAQGDVTSIEHLRGRTLTVDAMTTGFAFVLREMLAVNGVAEEDVTFERAGGVSRRFAAMLENPEHAATMQMTPFEILGEAQGLKTLTRASEVLGPYQGMTAAVRQSWANENREAVESFIRAYKRSVDWLYDPANRSAAEALLVANGGRTMTPELASRTYEILLGETTGFYRDVRPNIDGIKTVLRLRSKFGVPQKDLTDASVYVDTSFLEAAIGAESSL